MLRKLSSPRLSKPTDLWPSGTFSNPWYLRPMWISTKSSILWIPWHLLEASRTTRSRYRKSNNKLSKLLNKYFSSIKRLVGRRKGIVSQLLLNRITTICAENQLLKIRWNTRNFKIAVELWTDFKECLKLSKKINR